MADTHSIDLIAAHWLLTGQRPAAVAPPAPVRLRERAVLAAEAGYRGIGLLAEELDREVAEHGTAAVRAMIEDAGLAHVELEWPVGWWLGGDDWRASFERTATAGVAVGARITKAMGDFSAEPPSPAAMAALFDPLAAMGRDIGMPIALEIIAFSNIADVPSAMTVLGDNAGRGAGVMLDCWHFARRDLPLSSIAALSVECISGVEISDVGSAIMHDMFTDTLDHRLVPGEGVYPVGAFLRAVAATGYAGPVGLEVLNAGLREQGVPAALRACAEAATAIMAAAH